MDDVRPYWSIEACGWVRADPPVLLPRPRVEEEQDDDVLDLAGTDQFSGVPV